MYAHIVAVVLMVLGFKIFKAFQIIPRTRPKCLGDETLGVHKFFKSGGVKIHYVESGPQDKPLIMFVHGFPEFWYSWRHQIQHFNKDYHVVALDMRGYGDSDKPAGVHNYFIGNLVDDLKNLALHVNKPEFHLVAHDWGGAVAWYFAGKYPKMLKTYTACNIPHPTSLRDQQKASWEQMLKSYYIMVFQLPYLPEFMMMRNDNNAFNVLLKEANLHTDKNLVEAYKYAFPDFTTWNRTINYYRCAYRSVVFNKQALKPFEGLKNIKVPVMSIFGTGDSYLSVDSARGSSKYTENHELELLPDVSHWVQQQEPDKVNSLLQAFINKHQ